MFPTGDSMRRVLSAIAVTSCLIIGFPIVISAQSLPGFTIFSGIKRKPAALPLRFGDNPMDGIDIDSGFQLKAELSGSSIFHFLSRLLQRLDPDKIEVRIKDKKCRSKR